MYRETKTVSKHGRKGRRRPNTEVNQEMAITEECQRNKNRIIDSVCFGKHLYRMSFVYRTSSILFQKHLFMLVGLEMPITSLIGKKNLDNTNKICNHKVCLNILTFFCVNCVLVLLAIEDKGRHKRHV